MNRLITPLGFPLKVLVLCILTLLAVIIVANAQDDIFQDDVNIRIDIQKARGFLNDRWKSNHISRVEIIGISTNTVFRTTVSSSMIERVYSFKLIINDPESSDLASGLVKAIKDVQMSSSARTADLRWGCVFYGDDGLRAMSLYFDETGKFGVLDGACVGYSSNVLRHWIQVNCGNLFH